MLKTCSRVLQAHLAAAACCGLLLLTTVLASAAIVRADDDTQPLQWPEPTASARPWTRWWWLGSAVDNENLSRLIAQYSDAGLGGVEITCIYGVQGNEQHNLRYRSDEWVAAVQLAISEAHKHGMQVDMPAGSGWRMGGSSITPEYANSQASIDVDTVSGGEAFAKQFGRATPQAILAVSSDGQRVPLTDLLKDGQLEWQVPDGTWTIYSLSYRWAGDRVKRPGPGGEGLNINPYSRASVLKFLNDFSSTVDRLPGIRAQFHDSFEYEGNWQPRFLDEFAARRGYRLEDHLPALAGEGDQDLVGRVKCDYRQTLSDLVLDDLVETWVRWAHYHGQLARNQAHGSPGNWLDLYAACDIPETESFGRLQEGDTKQHVFKFASSAANVMGRPLVSSETATWLNEHFTVTLDQVKGIVDRQMLAGINHVFYHGTAYSPADAEWPGWLFYASTQLNPQNPIWRDFPALNAYVTRCQSILQQAKPDNDILLYWPIYDAWHRSEGLRMDVRVHNSEQWLDGWPIGDAARLLGAHGYAFDYVSDRGLAACEPAAEGGLQAPGGRYRMVVVPAAKYLQVATLERLVQLADAGTPVLYWQALPTSPPGLAGATPDEQWTAAITRAEQQVAEGKARLSGDLLEGLQAADVRVEGNLISSGISFLRKRWNDRPCYLVHNSTEQPIDEWVTPTATVTAAALMDPMTGRVGAAATRSAEDGTMAVRLRLAPGESLFLILDAAQSELPAWPYPEIAGDAVALDGTWKVDFVEGGPTWPESFETTVPKPWTEAPDDNAQRFAGTARYSTTFDAPSESATWRLDLGDVRGSARVRVNGGPVATLIAPPYVTVLDNLRPTGNQLEVEVTGVAANRIRDLDRQGVKWRKFEDINLVNIDYRPFDASDWPVLPLGLHGPVTLTPLTVGE